MMRENLFEIKNILKQQKEVNIENEINFNKKMIDEITKDWLKNMSKDDMINLLSQIKDELKTRGVTVDIEIKNTTKKFVIIDLESNNITFGSTVLDKNETLENYIASIMNTSNYWFMEITEDTTIFDLDKVLVNIKTKGIDNELK